MIREIFFAFLGFIGFSVAAQPYNYSVANAHSHNDYNNKIPFDAAYSEGFGSIEADILLQDGKLYVGHGTEDIPLKRTLEDYYLKPLLAGVQKNGGYPYPDTSRSLQLLIDVKTESIATLDILVGLLNVYPELVNARHLKFVISGNRPDASRFGSYPFFIWFDEDLQANYAPGALNRIAMLSSSLEDIVQWNGKSNTNAESEKKIRDAVSKAHALNKPVRFWAAPDIINSWYQLMHWGVDFINTDHIYELASFLNKLPRNSFMGTETYLPYQPTFKSDGSTRKAKNIILLIGDGMALPQVYAAYTANKGALNLFAMPTVGISKTSSYDNYITDSAPGATSISSGIKTNNRFVGVDHTGKAVTLIPELAAKRKIKTGLVTCGDIADATPADFYAHQNRRDNARGILQDLLHAPVDILMGSGDESLNNVAILNEGSQSRISDDIVKELHAQFNVVSSVDSVKDNANAKWIVIEKKAGLSIIKGRGNWLQKAFEKTSTILSKNKAGFFMMLEGAQVDYGGHDNNLGYVVTEMLDFDKTIGDALRFADKDGETLIIVTADHETGGLTLLDGDYTKGYVSGSFSTNDHTALPVPVFAYGPQSFRFRGVYENTALFKKMLEAFGL